MCPTALKTKSSCPFLNPLFHSTDALNMSLPPHRASMDPISAFGAEVPIQQPGDNFYMCYAPTLSAVQIFGRPLPAPHAFPSSGTQAAPEALDDQSRGRAASEGSPAPEELPVSSPSGSHPLGPPSKAPSACGSEGRSASTPSSPKTLYSSQAPSPCTLNRGKRSFFPPWSLKILQSAMFLGREQ